MVLERIRYTTKRAHHVAPLWTMAATPLRTMAATPLWTMAATPLWTMAATPLRAVAATFLCAALAGCGGDDSEEPAEQYARGEVGFEDFRVEVQDPTCALCHGEGSPLPVWNDFEVTSDACDDIRARVVGDRSMPPAGVEFSDAQRQLVDVWTLDGCPESAD